MLSARRPDELSSVSIRSKQTAEAFGRFDLGVDLGRNIQFVAQTLMVFFSVIMNEENSNGYAGCRLAKEHQFAKAFEFQRSEGSLQVYFPGRLADRSSP